MAERKKTVIDHLSACEKAGEALKTSPKAIDEAVNAYQDSTIDLINKAKKEGFDEIEFQGARLGIRVSKNMGDAGDGKVPVYDIDLAFTYKDLMAVNDHLEIKEKENESITDVESTSKKKKSA